jgi:hypothetical protein
LNCWFSAKGIGENKFSFPYRVRCTTGFKDFNNKGDVWNEIIQIAQETEQAGFSAVGEAVYLETFYFANQSDLVDPNCQAMIKSYMYCKESSTPPFSSLEKTPASFIDQFMIIKNELNYIHNQAIKERQNAKK